MGLANTGRHQGVPYRHSSVWGIAPLAFLSKSHLYVLSQVPNRTASALDGARPPSSAIRAWREAHCRRGRPRTLDGQSPLVAAEIVVLDNVISTRLLWPDSESPVNNQYALRVIRQAQNRNGHDVPTTWHYLSARDAAYLELALRLGGTLATNDQRLQAATRHAGAPLFERPA